MEFNERLNSFLKLRNALENINDDELNSTITKAKNTNPWFTESYIKFALQGIKFMLQEEPLKKWLNNYPKEIRSKKSIGVIMAGNIPMVGFHDLLCVLLSGHQLNAKLSSQDDVLIPFIAQKLIEIEPKWKDKIYFVDKLKGIDAVIATGSDNTSRYFEYYFRDLPKIIRKNRTSIAVINGKESPENLNLLGKDLYIYFGLGCRNVSKLFLPKGYNMVHLLDQLNDWSYVADNNKYANNFAYQRAIYAMEKIPHLDNGFTLFTENENLVSPTAVIYYEFYNNLDELNGKIKASQDKIQCIVSEDGWFTNSLNFGGAQLPEVWDYADNVDTMQFLTRL